MTFSRLREAVKNTFTGGASPHSLALGAAVGMFLALTPTMGIQMVLALGLATLLRANRTIAITVVWISNPLTILPLMYAYYIAGCVLVGFEAWSFESFSVQYDRLIEMGWLEATKTIGWELGYPLLVGSAVIAIVGGAASYLITFCIAKRFANRRKTTSDSSVEAASISSIPSQDPPERRESNAPFKSASQENLQERLTS